MKTRNIKLAARKHFGDTPIVVLEGPDASPEHRMVAQYEEVVKLSDQLDQRAFELGRDFLQDLAPQFPDNVTLKCLTIMNGAAFNEPTEEDCAYLLQHAVSQAQYGLNVYPVVKDGWQCAGKSETQIRNLQKRDWQQLTITENDISRLQDQFRKAGVPKDEIGSQMGSFLSRCKDRKISIPDGLRHS